ncbi:unnamed protein product [marine sediment metagenome]|uniref:DUF4198 domain-containing protein n=1 Tax=marine sediment metagenome TaxID=412755 RepID=X0RFT5_9ZZZZ
MRYPVCTKLGQAWMWLMLLLMVGYWTGPVNAHTLWIQSVEYNINPGQRNTMFMGWGHHLPVHDMLSTSWVKGFTIHEPDGERIEKKFPEDQKGYMTTPIVYTKEGTYRLTSQVVPGYYTVYIKEGDIHPHHHFGPKDTIKGEVSRIPMSLFYEMYTKCIITVGKQNGMANEPTGQRMEVILDKDPTGYRAGDTVNFAVLWEGKPLEHGALFYVMPQGESPYFDDFKYNKVPLQGGKGSFKITRPGIWYIKTAFTLNPSGDKVGKCNDMAYTAALTFQVDVEGDFPRPGFGF